MRPRPPPAISTVHAVLDRHGLVDAHGDGAVRAPTGTALSRPDAPNALWCADYKGEFMLGDRRYCYPLTITDFATPLSARLRGARPRRRSYAFTVFERAFKDFGLPGAIRTDNGVPFASGHALYGLSKLAVWWLRLGHSASSASSPGIPQQNGRHERMHLTLKKEATKPAAANVLQQQARFDAFVERYNHERPHQALAMQVPADVYMPSLARLPRPRGARLSVPRLDASRHAAAAASASSGGRSISARSLPARTWASSRSSEHIWLVTFMDYDLGFFDDETCRLEPIDNPFAPETVTHVSGINCYPCDRNGPKLTGGEAGIRTLRPRLSNLVMARDFWF